MFCLNIGRFDRSLRILIGLTLLSIALGLAFPQAEWRQLAWFGLVPFLTGLIGYCPAYAVAEISTIKSSPCPEPPPMAQSGGQASRGAR
ncbi:MAG: hypothetical protein RIQ68_674 [Pseudomonadota bacterium]